MKKLLIVCLAIISLNALAKTDSSQLKSSMFDAKIKVNNQPVIPNMIYGGEDISKIAIAKELVWEKNGTLLV